MKKRNRQKIKDFDNDFDKGELAIDFSRGIPNDGLDKIVKLPPLGIPVWLAAEIENIAKIQANSKSSVVRQLLVEAVQAKKKAA